MRPRIVGRATAYTSPWLEVEALDVELGEPRGLETFYTVKTNPYVVVFAVTQDGRVPLVLQYRPAVDEYVLELPSGHVDNGESLEQAARRELREETGCEARELVSLGELYVDSGRMQTLQAAFFAPSASVVAHGPAGEEELEIELVTFEELCARAQDGRFRMAAHLGVIGLAQLRGLIAL